MEVSEGQSVRSGDLSEPAHVERTIAIPASFVLASACLQNPCGIRIVLRELARKYFTAVR